MIYKYILCRERVIKSNTSRFLITRVRNARTKIRNHLKKRKDISLKYRNRNNWTRNHSEEQSSFESPRYQILNVIPRVTEIRNWERVDFIRPEITRVRGRD